MKKLSFLFMIFVCFICINTVKAEEFGYIGTAGGGGIGAGGKDCVPYDGYCLFNTRYNVGVRMTLVYCEKNGTCKDIIGITVDGVKKDIKSFDVWEKNLIVDANQVQYVGNSRNKTGATLKTDGSYTFFTEDRVMTNLFINTGVSGRNTFYKPLADIVSPIYINNIFKYMTKGDVGQLTTTDLQRVAAAYPHLSNKECTPTECYGFRIFIEPLFTWYKDGKSVVVATPTELAYLTNGPKDMAHTHDENGKIKGGNDYRLWLTAKSLYLNKNDVGINVPSLDTNDTFTNSNGKQDKFNNDIRNGLRNSSLGFGLNIIAPEYQRTSICEVLEEKNKHIIGMNYEQLNKLGNLTYGLNSIDNVPASWYRDNCSCEGIYNHYNNKTSKDITELSKNSIKNLFNDKYFEDGNQTTYGGFVNEKWDFNFYQNKGCKYKTTTDGGGLTCTDVINYYSGLGKDLSNMTRSQLNKVDFSLFNNAYKDQLTTDWSAYRYVEEGCPYDKTNCTPEYDLYKNGSVGTCYKGNLEYSDSDNWEDCVFTNAENDITNTSTNYKDDSLSNNYCEVYCREDLTVNFSQDIIVVGAGKNFTWNNHYMLGSRTCKTKSIDWKKFDSDLKASNQSVVDKYVKWQLEQKLSEVTWKASATKDCASSCDSYYPTYPCPTEKNPGRTCGGGCESSSYKDYYYHPSSTGESFSVNQNGYKASLNRNLSQSCGGAGYTVTQEQLNTYKTDYENAISTTKSIIGTMEACYDSKVWDSKIYNLDPKVSASYSDTSYSYLGDMKSTVNYQGITTDLNCKTDNVYKITDCSGTSCSGSNVSVENCTSVEMKKEATANFKIPSNVFQYIIKDTHVSINGDEFETYKSNYEAAGKTFNYINVGYGNFPVAYKTPNGYYGANSGKGDLSLKFSDLGHKVGDEQTKIDDLLSQADSELKYGDYKCEFQVVDGLIPETPNKEIDVIYRPIDLNNPFPDINGAGRKQGSNWCGSEECSMDSYNVKTYITNNRGVTTEDVYKEEPMYSFVLTPALIKEIRRYNNENSYAEYYGTYSGETYDFACTGNSKCISEYLTELIALTKATGSCTANRKDEFDSCR